MVFPVMFMSPLWAARRGGCRDRLSGDRRSPGRDGSPPGPAHTGNMDRPALADFLRHRREALRPADVGLPVGERRRACGLRREEVAALALMSVDYYTRLEQRRGPQPSEQMLASLARALRLTGSERDYLFQTAGHNPPAIVAAATQAAPALLRVLDCLGDTPALILSSLGEMLAQNRMAVALFGDKTGITGLARSEIYRWFTDPAERLHYPEGDRDRQSRAQVAGLRAAASTMGPTRGRASWCRRCRRRARSSPGCGRGTRSPSASPSTRSSSIPDSGRSRSTARRCSLRTSPRRGSSSAPRRPPRTTRSCSCSPPNWTTRFRRGRESSTHSCRLPPARTRMVPGVSSGA